MAMDDDMTPWCADCKLYHDHKRMVEIAQTKGEIKLTLALLLEVIADNDHKYPATECKTPDCLFCKYIADGYAMLRRL